MRETNSKDSTVTPSHQSSPPRRGGSAADTGVTSVLPQLFWTLTARSALRLKSRVVWRRLARREFTGSALAVRHVPPTELHYKTNFGLSCISLLDASKIYRMY
ncbi:hypothetical protein NDU88_003817 [Pleurodeles waltl]|uniref:Uncharacterized protein n=1 Tax=Pleurodeles waltl TaxID=8319 RepID=A0AAV7NRZ2_PLEWA|nr:hypothetical protein NDU88_003817 [Pleurodeles waltl]